MGGSGSTRRVTVQDDGGSGMVKVSESVVRRLVGQEDPQDTHGHERRHTRDGDILAQQDAEDLQRLRGYYEEKVRVLEKRNAELFQDQKEQFAQAVQDVEKKFIKTTASPICQQLQEEVLACYQANPKHTLLCSAHVKAFNECVQQQREKILTKKG